MTNPIKLQWKTTKQWNCRIYIPARCWSKCSENQFWRLNAYKCPKQNFSSISNPKTAPVNEERRYDAECYHFFVNRSWSNRTNQSDARSSPSHGGVSLWHGSSCSYPWRLLPPLPFSTASSLATRKPANGFVLSSFPSCSESSSRSPSRYVFYNV